MPIDPALVRRRCADLGGVIRSPELTAAGIDQYSLKKAVLAGALVRVRDGHYAVPDVPDVPVDRAPVPASAESSEVESVPVLAARALSDLVPVRVSLSVSASVAAVRPADRAVPVRSVSVSVASVSVSVSVASVSPSVASVSDVGLSPAACSAA